ncbi:MAG: replication initiator protein [Microviridae sp.]|nr:MAG: replication initiator protein [Microviridae sp.]
MACFHPLQAWKHFNGEVSFRKEAHALSHEISLPCGNCVGCRLERSRQWSVRIMHEASLHDKNCFITLTYDEAHVPFDSGLHYEDFQCFMRKLRRTDKVRFFMCGEYGSLRLRPHFHACLFGIDFDDGKPVAAAASGGFIYSSDKLSVLWPQGYCSVGELTHASAAYVARYTLKKSSNPRVYDFLDVSTGEVISRVPEFVRMSLKPGIGSDWYDKFKSDVYPHDRVIVNGRAVKPPKYYDRKDADFSNSITSLKRWEFAQAHLDDQTPERLSVREAVVKSRLSHLKRSL